MKLMRKKKMRAALMKRLARSSTLHRADAQTRTEVGGDEVIAVTL
jgi:hypothetical protein